MTIWSKIIVVSMAGVMCAMTHAASAAEINVISQTAMREILEELVPMFEKSTGHKVTLIWSGTVDIMKLIGGGEVVDLVIAGADSIDALTEQGKILAGDRVILAKSCVGVAIKAGAPKPDISSGDALKKALLAAKSIGYSTGPSGVLVARLFQRMGIADQIKSKVVVVAVGTSVGEAVARGEAEIGFQQVSELLPIKGIDFIGPLSPDVQQITLFPAGLHSAAPSPDAAKALVKFLTSAEAAPIIKRAGLEPG
jgi:molybdate transport system substrate-binding protein